MPWLRLKWKEHLTSQNKNMLFRKISVISDKLAYKNSLRLKRQHLPTEELPTPVQRSDEESTD